MANLPIFYVNSTDKTKDAYTYDTSVLGECANSLQFIYIYWSLNSLVWRNIQIVSRLGKNFSLTWKPIQIIVVPNTKEIRSIQRARVRTRSGRSKNIHKQNMRTKFNEVDWMAENQHKIRSTLMQMSSTICAFVPLCWSWDAFSRKNHRIVLSNHFNKTGISFTTICTWRFVLP